jgi:hypothetical protein
MGHSTGISDSYYRPTENDLLQDYLKCTDALTIQKDETILQEQVEDLKEKSKDNEYIVKSKLQEKDEQIQLLIQRDAHNTDAISSMSDMLLEMRKKLEALEKKHRC